MGLNVSKARSLLRDLHGKDPDAEARQQLIPPTPQTGPARLQAIDLMASDLVRDPYGLVPGSPPTWLVDLSETGGGGATLLFDGRLTDLARRIVDDVVSQGLTPEQLIGWLEARAEQAAEPAVVGGRR